MADIEFRYLDDEEKAAKKPAKTTITPKPMTEIGAGIRSSIPNIVPPNLIQPAHDAVSMAESTLKGSVVSGVPSLVSRRIVEEPPLDNIVGIAGAMSPLSTVAAVGMGAVIDSEKGRASTTMAQQSLANGVHMNKGLTDALDMLGRATNINVSSGINGATYLAKTMPKNVFHETVKLLAQVGTFKATDSAKEFVKKKLANTAFGKTISNITNPVEFDSAVRSRLFESKRKVYDKFGSEIDDFMTKNPSKNVNMQSTFSQLSDDAAATVEGELLNPGIKREVLAAAKKTKNNLLIDILENPENASNLTLKDLQEIKNSITQIPSISSKLAKRQFAQWKPGDRYLMDLVDDINNEIVQLNPAMVEVKDVFADYMYKYNQVKNYFTPKSLLGKLRNGFVNEVVYGFTKDVLNDVGLVKQIDNFRRASKAIKFGGRVAAAGASILALQKALGSLRRGGEDTEYGPK